MDSLRLLAALLVVVASPPAADQGQAVRICSASGAFLMTLPLGDPDDRPDHAHGVACHAVRPSGPDARRRRPGLSTA